MQDNLLWVDKVDSQVACQCKIDLLPTWEDLLDLQQVLDQWVFLQVELLLVAYALLAQAAHLLVLELEPYSETLAKILLVVNLLSDDLNVCCSMNFSLIPLLTLPNFCFRIRKRKVHYFTSSTTTFLVSILLRKFK